MAMGQKRIELTASEKNKFDLGLSKMHLSLGPKSRIHTYKPYKRVKFTFKTTMNSNVLSKISLAEIVDLINDENVGLGEAIDSELSDLDVTDYVSIMAYDVRFKIYLPHHTSVVLRCFVTGIQLNTYNYTIGFSYKF